MIRLQRSVCDPLLLVRTNHGLQVESDSISVLLDARNLLDNSRHCRCCLLCHDCAVGYFVPRMQCTYMTTSARMPVLAQHVYRSPNRGVVLHCGPPEVSCEYNRKQAIQGHNSQNAHTFQASRPVRRRRSSSNVITEWAHRWPSGDARGDNPEGSRLGYTARGPGHGNRDTLPPLEKKLKE